MRLSPNLGVALLFGVAFGCSKERPLPNDGPRQSPREATTDSTTGASGDGRSASDAGSSDGDAWRPWHPDCAGVRVAEDPATVVPPLAWKDCDGGVEGCRELEVTWPTASVPFKGGFVNRVHGEEVLGVLTWSPGEGGQTTSWSFLARASGEPLGAWLNSDADGKCSAAIVGATDRHYCLALNRIDPEPPLTPGGVALLSPDSPASEVLSLTPSNGIGYQACTSQLTLARDAANRVWIYQIDDAALAELVVPDGEVHLASAFGDHVLVTRLAQLNGGAVLDAWSWSHSQGARALDLPGTGHVFELQTDGEYLVWTRAAGAEPLAFQEVEVFTARWVPGQTDVSPRRLGTVPNTVAGIGAGLVRNGHYAVLEGRINTPDESRRLHVFRLSDGEHFVVPNPAGTLPGLPLHVSADAVWYYGERTVVATIIQQEL